MKERARKVNDWIKGGKGDNVLAKDVPRNELKLGIPVEREHASGSPGRDKNKIAREIAIDHLSDNKFYYSAFAPIEKFMERIKDKKTIARFVEYVKAFK